MYDDNDRWWEKKKEGEAEGKREDHSGSDFLFLCCDVEDTDWILVLILFVFMVWSVTQVWCRQMIRSCMAAWECFICICSEFFFFWHFLSCSSSSSEGEKKEVHWHKTKRNERAFFIQSSCSKKAVFFRVGVEERKRKHKDIYGDEARGGRGGKKDDRVSSSTTSFFLSSSSSSFLLRHSKAHKKLCSCVGNVLQFQ